MVISDLRQSSRFWSLLVQLLMVLLAWTAPGHAIAQDASAMLTPSPQSFHPWQVPPPQGAAQAYFVNLSNDDQWQIGPPPLVGEP